MNKSSIAGIFKGAAVASVLALISPNTSWADDHLLSVNGATVTQNAVVTHAGAVTQPLVLSNFDAPPASVTLGQSQTLTVVSAPVKMCKPGTRINKKWPPPQDPAVYQLEWLDQGDTVVGVTGVLTGTSSGTPQRNYRLTLTMTGISDTYTTSNGPCSVSGQKTYTYTAGALIERQSGSSDNYTTILSSTYNFWNVPPSGTAPEPGTALLMLIGLVILGWMSMKRMRTVPGASA